MHHFDILAIFLLLRLSLTNAGIGGDLNLTNFFQHRQKRSLIFEGSGVCKLVIGPIFPLQFDDPVNWRSMITFYNFQGGQYPLPTVPIYPWDKWEDTFARSLQRQREEFDRTGKYKVDDSRIFAYKAMEAYMNAKNINGQECLLRSICENAQTDEHIGLFAELVNILLTPGKVNIDELYTEAHTAGKSGVDCFKLYSRCPPGASILDQFMNEL